MSIQRIDSPKHQGWQARAFLPKRKRLTKFLSDGPNGGYRAAYAKAQEAEAALKRKAKKLRKQAQ